MYIPWLITHTLFVFSAIENILRCIKVIEGVLKSSEHVLDIYMITQDTMLWCYEALFTSTFDWKTSKIATISYILEDAWNYSYFTCFSAKSTRKECFVASKYVVLCNHRCPKHVQKTSLPPQSPLCIAKCSHLHQKQVGCVEYVMECTYFPLRLPRIQLATPKSMF